ncbi:MAG: caspase family protein [Oscillatoriales cyanobacterium C42_A2020_001]|nr:caspase family protein [Leptolyngbyaceae cyanobacterium C42_A2020_001]
MGLTRRNFLQQSGLALAAWGASTTGLWTLGDRYQQALALPAARKLALLIGINQYPFGTGLEGCVTDVELQRELLIHRFGFQPTDVLTLTDWQATREAVETAFVEHLIQQAKAGDVVVVHFSGFGSTLTSAPETLRTSLVMADAVQTGEAPVVNDLLDETLWLLLRSLKTDRVTTILDTSYVYPGSPLQGNLRVRSYPNPSTAQPSPAELAFQATLLTQLRLDREKLAVQRKNRPLPGLVLTAAAPTQVATEVRWNRFTAGLFTESLTQAVWQASQATSISVCFERAAQQVEQIANQQPQLSGQRSQESVLSSYFSPGLSAGAVGAIAAVDDINQTVQLWLGGLPAPLLDQYGVNSLVQVLSHDPNPAIAPTRLQILSREGVTAKAKVFGESPLAEANLPPLQVGQLVQESVRVLPRNIGLTVALNSSLERIERVDAVSAFTAVPHISSAIAGEQPADYVFSKTPSPPTQLASLPTNSLQGLTTDATASGTSYGLFSPGHDAILSTTGEGGEAIKVAVRRLVPKLQSLLATKLLNLTVNDQTSRLEVRANLELLAPQTQILSWQETGPVAAAPTPATTVANQNLMPLQIPIGRHIRYQVENKGQHPIYPLAISLDSSKNLLWLMVPAVPTDGALAPGTESGGAAIAAQTASTIPGAATGADWQIQGPTGLAETYLIFSRAPFNQTVALLTSQQRTNSSAIAGTTLTNPLDVVQAIMQDLHQAAELPTVLNQPDTYALNVNAWATLRFVYQIV